ncbi:MAG: glycerol kinase, partial [Actinobacteria bacterium]|nr:glycerol kinase [Actinomycetota bacterium]
LGVPVERPRIVDTTGLGAAFLAGLGTGVWSSQEEIAATWALDRRFEPGNGTSGPREADDAAYRQWLKAVERSKGWEEQPAR